MDRYGVAQFLQFGPPIRWRQPARNEIDQPRASTSRAIRSISVDALSRLDKNNVRPCARIPIAALDGFVESKRRPARQFWR